MSFPHELGTPAVYERFDRPDPELLRKLSGLGVATVHEAMQRTGCMRDIHARAAGARICGPAVTSLDHAGDNIHGSCGDSHVPARAMSSS